MKLILTAILIITLVSPLALRVQASSNQAGDPVIPIYTSSRPTDQENVLIFLDNLPWGLPIIQTLLDSLGATYTEAASSEMATIDMDPFDVIIMASEQPNGFYREFQAQIARFEDYLYSGGVLEFHCATLEMSFWQPLTLPGGVTHEVEENHYNFKANENHPILAGLPDTLHGSFASHEHFWNLPPGTDVITIDEVDLPTTIEYGFGAGTVLATGMAWEFNYNFGYTSGGCLPNAIAYALSISGGSAVAVDLLPFNPPIQIPAGGGSFDYNITVMNYSDTLTVCDVWCDILLPDSSTYGPVLGPVSLSMPPGYSGDRDRTQVVPAGAPAGEYIFQAWVGIYPSDPWDYDAFTFEKLSVSDTGVDTWEWSNNGEELDLDEVSIAMPAAFSLNSPYPNPFNPATTLSFDLPDAGFVKLAIYDNSGRLVVDLVDGWRGAGAHEVTLDASNLASGIYLAKMGTGAFSVTQKLILVK